MSSSPIAVTGVTGVLGSQVATELASKGIRLRLLVRGGSARAPTISNAEVVDFNGYQDRSSCVDALRGCEVCFMVSGMESPDRLQQHFTFIDAIIEAGVKHVVYTSFMNAAADCVFHLAREHHHTEKYIREKNVQYTFLRNNFYQELISTLAGDDGVIRGPAGRGKVSPVARKDVSSVAAAILAAPSAHQNKTYTLTGPQQLDLEQVSELLSKYQKRSVTYIDETMEEAKVSRASSSAEEWLVEAWISTYTAIRDGELAGVSSDVETILGRKPISFADYLAEMV